METVSGYISHIIYQNADNGYAVFELKTDDGILTVTGNAGMLAEGLSLECHGRTVNHPTYGEQFALESYEQIEPRDQSGIERYLGSGAIKGIGPALATRIVKEFGADTIRVIEEEPELLSKVRGISESGARAIGIQVSEQRDQRNAMIFLQKYGISLALSLKIYETYGNEVYSVLEKNPYRLADDVTGVGFKIADGIAMNAGFAFDCDFRIKSGICYVLVSAISEGHTYLPVDVLLGHARAKLGVDEVSRDYLTALVMDKKIVISKKCDEEIVYLKPYYYMERGTAEKLTDLDVSFPANAFDAEKILEEIEDADGFEHDECQKEAVISAMTHGVTVITGGPGTGKTTTIDAIIKIFESQDMEVVLAAPTGRAAKRMMEATNHAAKTIHRLLEFEGGDDDDRTRTKFMRNESNPLEADVIIIDETSMVDIFLMSALVKAVPIGSHLILVGDANQLPSVGPGNVLRDIIDSGFFNVVRLEHIFRQSEVGDIIINAHKINAGEEIDTDVRSDDFLFVKRGDISHILGSTITLVTDKLPKYIGANRFDIQVLTPTRKGPLGVENLNKVLQDAINPPQDNKREKQSVNYNFREGDKVIHIKNNYELEWREMNKKGYTVREGKGVFNGDIGYIKSINLFAEELTVIYDENREVTYPFSLLIQLELAYALTVHKSQGSEYPAVVIPLLGGPRQLLNRNLIYTAVTRARQCVCIVGSPDTFLQMVANNEQLMRYSALSDMIREAHNYSALENIGGLEKEAHKDSALENIGGLEKEAED